jgi:hypothetical protein
VIFCVFSCQEAIEMNIFDDDGGELKENIENHSMFRSFYAIE